MGIIPLAKNLARKKFISSFTLGLIDSKKVQFQEIAICVEFGEHFHRKVQKIKSKPDGYKLSSFFRKGLNIIRRGLKIQLKSLFNSGLSSLAYSQNG